MNAKKLLKQRTQQKLFEKKLKEVIDKKLAECESDSEREEIINSYLSILDIEKEN